MEVGVAYPARQSKHPLQIGRSQYLVINNEISETRGILFDATEN